MPVIMVTRLRLKDPALFDEFFASAVAVVEQAQSSKGNLGADVLAVASGIRCKSTGAVPASGVRLGGRSDSFGLIVGLGCCDSAWPQLAGRFEQRAAQVLEQPQPVTGHGEAAPAG